ncbi:hypothetical protein KBD20_02695, partial [Candidatus Saccharibacteria bacterium]|nr:hypothetical protein [Candidatus Saccharibacteria bacterium]
MDEATKLDIKQVTKDILETIDRDREREIIARRFGLYDRKETLEQIGELLGITRERVRQLEKAILIRLKLAAEKDLPHVGQIEKEFVKHLSEMGRVARVSDLALKVSKAGDDRDKAHTAFLATLAPNLTVLDENDDFFQAVAIKEYFDEKKLKEAVTELVKTIKTHGTPVTIPQLHEMTTGYEHPDHVRALASVSKLLAHLKDQWG